MDNPNYTIEHRKGQHLSSEERHDIEVHLRDGWSTYKIAKHLGRPYNTIKNEIQRGTVLLYGGKLSRYKAKAGEEKYKVNRRSSTRKYRFMETAPFLRYVEKMVREEGWSLDTCRGHALEAGLFQRKEMVCTKTLYNYVDSGMMALKNIDLPEKVSRNTKKRKVRENKKKLGDSIDLREKCVETREDFGNWEIDSVLGKRRQKNPAL
ncbi:MAG: IS30 family transposase [Clostridiales bacterium]|nr:IS30 family transposase [Clostridiales bacterium]